MEKTIGEGKCADCGRFGDCEFAERTGLGGCGNYKDGKRTIFVITASGTAFNTEVRIAYSYDEAKEVGREIFKDMKMDGDDVYDDCHGCVRGYSTSANCEVEIAIHEREIDNGR